jgi:hypothetical protein
MMIFKMKYALLALPLALAVSACESPAEKQEEEAQAETVAQPGFDGTAATPSEARDEAYSLAAKLSSGDLDPNEAVRVLEDLDNLVSENLTDFPEDMRPALTEDIESARDALEADDEAGMREAATQFQNKLSDAATGSEAQ